MDKQKIISCIDHTNLKNNFSEKEMISFFEEARNMGFASVCVFPMWITLARKYLMNTRTKICTVIGFPFGQQSIDTKTYEAVEAVKKGADEIDVVWNVNMCKSGNEIYLLQEITRINSEIKKINPSVILKVIVETCLLNEQEKIMACRVIKNAKADFIKTSSGFSTSGANQEDIKLFAKELNGTNVKIKASGGINSLEDADLFLDLGAHRIGTSAGIKMIKNSSNNPSKEGY